MIETRGAAPERGGDLVEYVEAHAARLAATGRTGNARVYTGLARNLRDFLRGRAWPVCAAGRDMVQGFHAHLRERGVQRNTLSAYMRPLRAVLRRIHREGLGPYDSGWFEGVYLGVDKTAKRAVRREALAALRRVDLSARPSLALARDLFLFSFYMRGMAFADIARLTRANLAGGEVVYARRKTGQLLRVCLEPQAREIIDRYAAEGRERLFPVLRDDTQACYDSAIRVHNARLKRVARLAGVEVRLSSYMARHSWATIARDMGVEIEVISAGMGHSSVQTTRIYLDEIDNVRLDAANRMVTDLG